MMAPPTQRTHRPHFSSFLISVTKLPHLIIGCGFLLLFLFCVYLFLIVGEYANDQKTDIKQCGSFLVNFWDKNDDGKAVNIKHGRYSQDQYDKIMNMANCDGDRPVIDADLQVNYAQGHRIISNSISRPDIAFDLNVLAQAH